MNLPLRQVVIVGAGQAGVQAAASLRDEGYTGAITLLGQEPGLPYQRPPLSKSWLAGGLQADDIHLETCDWYRSNAIDYRAGDAAVSIDRQARRVLTRQGNAVPYEHLILATGARNRELPLNLQGIEGVLSIRDMADASALQARLASVARAVVVGAGFLGLEAASVMAKLGVQVEVVEATERVMARALGEQMALALQRRHQQQGIVFHFGRRVVQVDHADGQVQRIVLDDGRRLEADVVLVAIGVQPNVELAMAAGLATANGVRVDNSMFTSDQAISAIGDCACFDHGFDEAQPWRLESVQNAVDQARHVAARLMGQQAAYRQVPLFWTEQAGSRLQIAGVAQSGDLEVIRGDCHSESFSVLRYRGHQLVSVESLNCPADHMAARKLLLKGVSPAVEDVSLPGFELRNCLSGSPVRA